MLCFRVARQFPQEKAKLRQERTKKKPNTFSAIRTRYSKKQIFGKELNKKFESKQCDREPKRTKRTKQNIWNQTLSKRTRFEGFGFNETKLATLLCFLQCALRMSRTRILGTLLQSLNAKQFTLKQAQPNSTIRFAEHSIWLYGQHCFQCALSHNF